MVKHLSIYFIFIVTVFFNGTLFPVNFNITKVGEWGTGVYRDVFVKGNYAYCTADYAGLDIIDISSPVNPVKIGSYDTPGFAYDVYVSGNYAYVADGEEGLQVIDVSNPFFPSPVGNHNAVFNFNAYCVYVAGNFAYIGGGKGLQIIDVSNPSSPFLVGHYEIRTIEGLYIKDNYAYVVGPSYGMEIIDVSDPSSPSRVGGISYIPPSTGIGINVMTDIYVRGKYAYALYILYESGQLTDSTLVIANISDPSAVKLTGTYDFISPVRLDGIFVNDIHAYIASERGLQIIDVSSPSMPLRVKHFQTAGTPEGIFIDGQYAYVADTDAGLQVMDISSPASPSLVGNYDNCRYVNNMDVSGNYVFMSAFNRGLDVLDVSDPGAPTPVGSIDIPSAGFDVHVKGNYAYLAGGWGFSYPDNYAMCIIDVSNPTSPVLTGTYIASANINDVFVTGDYAYLALGNQGLEIADVSTPSTPALSGRLDTGGSVYGVYVSGNYAYIADYWGGLKIIDVSTPSTPVLTGQIDTSFDAYDVRVSGQYAYIIFNYQRDYDFEIFDVSNPSSPKQVGFWDGSHYIFDLFVKDNYVYAASSSMRLDIIDVSNPSSPGLVGHYNTSGYPSRVHVKGNYIYVEGSSSGRQLSILYSEPSTVLPEINLSKKELIFSSDDTGTVTGAQRISISNSGAGNLTWSAAADQEWLGCSPSSGNGSGQIFISVDTTALAVGSYSGTITVADALAANSPQTVTVTLYVHEMGHTSQPFGVFSTPPEGSTVRSSVPFTGWALDDTGVRNVEIFREDNGALVYVGNAVFVEGARPDVEALYPGYPNNDKAGWGYMMLTNFLPGGGNGTFRFHAVATDLEGNRVTLGTRTIYCDNANAVKPFGAIDTPEQGGIASGNSYVNFGWALTPLPNTIPTDGSFITVWVDGVPSGNPVYDQYRGDIAALFPGYNNSDGAVGYYYLDTTQYDNGVHTIQWTVTDDTGNTDGIGSRYFTILNSGGKQQCSEHNTAFRFREPISKIPVDYHHPLLIKRGYNTNGDPVEVHPDDNGTIHIEIKELERLVIFLNNVWDKDSSFITYYSSFHFAGSFLDSEKGVFYWQTGPGFVGKYPIAFIKKDQYGNMTKKKVLVTIMPKFSTFIERK